MCFTAFAMYLHRACTVIDGLRLKVQSKTTSAEIVIRALTAGVPNPIQILRLRNS